jgi:DNA-binding transcriptional LysR family regulator
VEEDTKHLQGLVEAPPSLRERDAGGGVVGRRGSRPHPGDQAPAGEDVDGGQGLGQLQRAAQHGEAGRGDERHVLRRLDERGQRGDDPFDLVVPDRHPLARRSSVALDELAGETWIGGTPGGAYARIVLHSCRAAGFEPRVAFGSDDYNAVQAFVAVGLGVAISPRLALTSMRPGLARVALAEPPVRRIAAARLAASFRSAATASMLRVLKEQADAFVAAPAPAGG